MNTMGTYIPIFALVQCLFTLASVHGFWYSWGPWTPWSECLPGSNRSRTRQHCDQKNPSYCWDCLSPELHEAVVFEKCETCKNGGTWQDAGCLCTDRYYGTYCESRVNKCDAVPADVIFVLDSSLSQTEEQFNKQLDFAARFIDASNVSVTEFQFAVVTFSTNAVTEIGFDSSLSKNDHTTKVKNIPFRPGATFTNKGLEMASSLLSTRGNRLGGLTIVKFAFILTDGMSTNMTETKEAAIRLRRDATVVAIGVGREVLHTELQSIASPPDANSLSYVYSVENFDALNGLIGRLIDATCEKCAVSHMTDIVVVIDDLSESAMKQQEFSRALDGLTYIAQSLPAYGQAHGQTVTITTIGDLGFRHTSIPNATDLGSLLTSIQSIRQQQSSCYIDECDKALVLNISSGMIHIINITGQNNYQRNNSRKIIVVFSSGRFMDKSLARLELQDALNESNNDIFAIGHGFDIDMEGLHAIVKEPYNVFTLLDDNLETLDVFKSKLSYIVCS